MLYMRSGFRAALLAVICLASAATIQADTVTINITNPQQTVSPGATIVFSGVVTNTTQSTIAIEGQGIGGRVSSLNGPLSDNGFLLGIPLTLAPGQSTGVVPLLYFTINSGFGGSLPFTVQGLYVVFNNGNPSLGTADLSITVAPPPSAVPEPATMILLGTGLTGVVMKRRRRS